MGVEGFVAATSESVLTAWLRSEGFPVRVTEMPWLNRWRPFRAVFHACRIAYWARQERIELIHCNEHNVHPFGYLVASIARLPVVCSVRCRFGPAFGQWAFKRFPPSAITWSTQNIKNECLSALPKGFQEGRLHIVPEGIDMQTLGNSSLTRDDFRRKLGIASTDIVIGMACALRPGKRVEDFLIISERIRSRFPMVRFVLAGAGVRGEESYTEQLIAQIRSAESKGILNWVGHIAQIREFLDAIDVFVSTSEHESFGMSVCESMAYGKPVCGYAACSVAEVVGDTGLIVENGDVAALIAATETLVVDEHRRSELGQKARQRVLDEFNPEKSLRQLCQIYDGILSGRQQLNGKNALVSASTN